MIMCIQNLVSICLFFLKILSKIQFLTSIKGFNSVANLQKTMIYDTNIDLVNDNVYTKFGLNLSIRFEDIEQKLNSDVNQGQITLMQICRNSNSSKLSCMSSLPARMKKTQSKMKALECSQDFSHYKSMGIYSIRSRAANSAVLGPIWPKFELVLDIMVPSLPARIKKIRSKMKEQECSQQYT